MTDKYQHILLAIDFSEQSELIAAKAKELSRLYRAKLSIVHVLDNIAMPDTAYDTVIPLDQDSHDEALEAEKNKLIDIADSLDIDRNCRWLVWGVPKQEITQVADEQQADLIVVGSHGRHGLELLLGSTTNAILHHANCDVIAVRLRDA
ncbi:universal stress protein [Thiolapillus sp.]|uniref:universal stress protein n=1 Tax=Thiolapillus sp. TaxID=2017437 RepID=UPI003AF8CD78